MANPVFIQDSRIGRVIFDVTSEELEMTASRFGKKSTQRLPLRHIDPAFVRKSQHLYLLTLIPLILALVCIGAIRVVLHQEVVPHELALWLGFLACVFFWQTVRGIPPVEFYEFRNCWGKIAFQIVRERKQAEECDAFVSDLTLRLQMAENDIPASEISFPSHTNSAVSKISQGRWKVSILLGGFGAGFPLVPGYDFTAEPIIILLCTGGLALGVFSFLAKEPRRWYSIIGMVLSLIPPYFY